MIILAYLLLIVAFLLWFFGGVFLIGGNRKVGLCIMGVGGIFSLLSVFLF